MVKRAGGALLLSIRIEHGSSRPVSTQLHTGLRDLILSGGFAPGQRLPASRTLARELAVPFTPERFVIDPDEAVRPGAPLVYATRAHRKEAPTASEG